jgi:glycine hydroxymethyltransferase
MHVIAAKAVAFLEALQPEFRIYQKEVISNAQMLGTALMDGGLDLVTKGTDTHVLLVDLRPKNVTGKDTEKALGRANITCNKNAIPYDPQKPAITSGIRLGSPAGTTRGFGNNEFKKIGEWIVTIINGLEVSGPDNNADVEKKIKKEVMDLCRKFPIYSTL